MHINLYIDMEKKLQGEYQTLDLQSCLIFCELEGGQKIKIIFEAFRCSSLKLIRKNNLKIARKSVHHIIFIFKIVFINIVARKECCGQEIFLHS